jgi:starch synthase
MVIDGETGVLVPSRDPVALAAAIEELVHDPARARACGLAGRARALSTFGVAAHVERVCATYEALLAAR